MTQALREKIEAKVRSYHDCGPLTDSDCENLADAILTALRPDDGKAVPITALEEQQMFDDWCPYKGSPDPRVVWSAAISAANNLLLSQPAIRDEGEAVAEITGYENGWQTIRYLGKNPICEIGTKLFTYQPSAQARIASLEAESSSKQAYADRLLQSGLKVTEERDQLRQQLAATSERLEAIVAGYVGGAFGTASGDKQPSLKLFYETDDQADAAFVAITTMIDAALANKEQPK